jgi:hypothetical protein
MKEETIYEVTVLVEDEISGFYWVTIGESDGTPALYTATQLTELANSGLYAEFKIKTTK